MLQTDSITASLVVNQEFKKFLPELSFNQRQNLEKDIIEKGCLSPIIVQKDTNTILDGHTRYDICQKNNISFSTVSLDLKSDEDIKFWMLKNQINRRDLSKYEKILLSITMSDIYVKSAIEKRNSRLKNSKNDVNQNSDYQEKSIEKNTNRYLSELCHVSHDTIARVRKIEKYIDEETRKQLINEKLSINQVYQDVLKRQKQEKRLSRQKENARRKEIEDLSRISEVKHREKLDFIDVLYVTRKYNREEYIERITKFSSNKSIVFIWSENENIEENISLMKELNFQYEFCHSWFNEIFSDELQFLLIFSRNQEIKVTRFFSTLYCEKSETKIPPLYFMNEIRNHFPKEVFMSITDNETYKESLDSIYKK